MTRKLLVAGLLIGATTLGACTMTDTQRRTATGATIGGVAAGAISGEWGWAAAGAAAGAVSGYLYDQHKKGEEEAYRRGVQDGRGK